MVNECCLCSFSIQIIPFSKTNIGVRDPTFFYFYIRAVCKMIEIISIPDRGKYKEKKEVLVQESREDQEEGPGALTQSSFIASSFIASS